ncbi:MAG: RlmE family RNA methyltransferase [Nitrososphaerales archaeon]
MRLQEAKRDYYRRTAKKEGFRSRAAYKLLEINNSYHIIMKGMYVVDLGCAPGGWLQVASKVVGQNGKVLGIDLRQVDPLPNVVFIQGAVDDNFLAEKILNTMGRKVNVLLSDVAPNVSGVWQLDHARQISLTQNAVSIAVHILVKNGSAVLKAFEGDMFNELRDELKRKFSRVHLYKPRSSRKESSEMYLVCLGYNGS